MSPRDNLNRLGLTLPEASTPGGNYVSVNIRENIAYIAIQFPILNGEFKYQGRLGQELSIREGYLAMEMCALNVLSQVEKHIGLDDIAALITLTHIFRQTIIGMIHQK